MAEHLVMSDVEEVVASKCGTYAGLNSHNYYGTTPCEPCRAAGAAYQRERRSRPDVGIRERERTKASSRALWRLAKEYPVRFRQLVAEELEPTDDPRR